eukprot:685188_1
MTAIAQADNAPQSKRQQYMRTSMSNNDPDTTVDVPKEFEEGTYAVAPTEEVLLDNGNIPVIAPNAPQQNTTDDSNQQLIVGCSNQKDIDWNCHCCCRNDY